MKLIWTKTKGLAGWKGTLPGEPETTLAMIERPGAGYRRYCAFLSDELEQDKDFLTLAEAQADCDAVITSWITRHTYGWRHDDSSHARLLAAAPDLLDALEDAELSLRSIGIGAVSDATWADIRFGLDSIRTAKAKAKGGTAS